MIVETKSVDTSPRKCQFEIVTSSFRFSPEQRKQQSKIGVITINGGRPAEEYNIQTHNVILHLQYDHKRREWFTDIKYGLNSHYQNRVAKEPGLPTERYRIHSSIRPFQWRSIKEVKSGREFKIELLEREGYGFLVYCCSLVEISTGKRVATIYYEDYYKD